LSVSPAQANLSSESIEGRATQFEQLRTMNSMKLIKYDGRLQIDRTDTALIGKKALILMIVGIGK